MSRRIIKLALVLLLALFPSLLFASASKLSFTTNPQTLAPNTISPTLTIQLQDGNGASTPSTETMDISFTSTSPTGSFLSPSSDNPVTTTLSTGSANKNFRYRDTTEGTFTLTVTATGRTSHNVFTANQGIIISLATSTATSTGPTATSTTETATSTATTTTSSSSSSSSSASDIVYYSASPLSARGHDVGLDLSAGRDRVGTVGSPLEFRAETNLISLTAGGFTWNFGDGAEAYGGLVTHTYEYPGDYVVVLNANLGAGMAVARANVKIVASSLKIISADADKITVENDAASEASLFGRALWVKGKGFAFPQDTIIKPGQKIAFSAKVTGLAAANLNDVQFLTIGSPAEADIPKKIEEKRTERVTELQHKLALLQEQLALMPRPVLADASLTGTTTDASSTLQTTAAASALPTKGFFQTFKRFFLGK